MQDSLDQVSSWCDNNHMVANPIKTQSMTIATRQKQQLLSLLLDLVLLRVKSDQVSAIKHRLLGLTIDNEICWDSHTISRRVFFFVKAKVPCRHRHQETVLSYPH